MLHTLMKALPNQGRLHRAVAEGRRRALSDRSRRRFDIIVEAQTINTLSGSGKAVANIAICISLGQILTNRMADEFDAAMDSERAEHTAQALRRLTTIAAQIILVTHKWPETDRTVGSGR